MIGWIVGLVRTATRLVLSLYPGGADHLVDAAASRGSDGRGPRRAEPRPGRAVYRLGDALRHLPGAWLDHLRTRDRSSRPAPWVELRHAARALRRSGLFAPVTAVVLAVGVAATALLFAAVVSTSLAPVAHPEADRLTMVLGESGGHAGMSFPNFEDVRRRARSFDALAAYVSTREPATWVGPEWAIPVEGFDVTPSLAATLSARPVAGRWLTDEDDRPDGPPVVVVAGSFAERWFGTAESALDGRIDVGGVEHRIVGVMPTEFTFPNRQAEFWRPLRGVDDGGPRSRAFSPLSVLGRISPGTERDAAGRELETLAAELRREHPAANRTLRLAAVSRAEFVAGDLGPRLWLLLAAAGFALALSCANVAMLLYGRSLRRLPTLLVHVALGASRGRVARAVLLEGVLIAVVGTALGMAGAVATLEVVGADAFGTPRPIALGWDIWTGSFLAVVTLGTALAVGLGPSAVVFLLGRRAPSATSLTPRILAGQRWIVVGQAGLATALLLGGSVVVGGYAEISGIDPGFRVADVAVLHVELPRSRYRFPEPRLGYFATLEERLGALPGVEGVTLSSQVFEWADDMGRNVVVEGADIADGDPPSVVSIGVGRDYFEHLGMPVLAGRGFRPEDDPSSPPVAVVNRTAARRFWGDDSPVGRRIKFGRPGSSDPWLTVVGIVADGRRSVLGSPPIAEVYLPYEQNVEFRSRRMFVLLATTGTGPDERLVRRAVAGVDAEVAIREYTTLEDIRAEGLRQPRLAAGLVSAFSVGGVLLALAGVFAMLTLHVSSRTREIGIRLALGAGRWRVGFAVARQAVRLVAVGGAAGLLLVRATDDVLVATFVGADPVSARLLALVPLTFLVLAFAASAVPAMRAARIHPLEAIRTE